jgi:hypothetical protein
MTAGTQTVGGTKTLSGTNTHSGVNTFSNTTDASSSTAGGVIMSGGLAVAKLINTGSGVVFPNASNSVSLQVSTLNWYGVYSPAGSFTGPVSITPDVYLVREGSFVTFYCGSASATSTNNGIFTYSVTLPAEWRPHETWRHPFYGYNNSSVVECHLDVATTGSVILRRGNIISPTTFVNTGLAGVYNPFSTRWRVY